MDLFTHWRKTKATNLKYSEGIAESETLQVIVSIALKYKKCRFQIRKRHF